MPGEVSHSVMRDELRMLLSAAFPGIDIEVEHSARWDRTCVTFRWEGFAEMLPEERFRRLLMHIPAECREESLRGAIWLELAPGETVEEYLALPRSDDIAGGEKMIAHRLIRSGFFEELERKVGPLQVEQCMASLALSRDLLRERGFSPRETHEACLLFIRHGAYADCEVLLQARPAILELETPS
jgi:hypothetical protein